MIMTARLDRWTANLDQMVGSPATNASIFLTFVLFGSGYIIVSKTEGISQTLITLVPVGIICLYAFCLWLFRALRLRDDQSGDNIYYMGFLFTLVSLAVSLYHFT